MKAAQATRRRILEAAFAEFYRHGFQGGSLNRIVDSAGTTKGALFHHFAGKLELGYAVLDDVIEPLLMSRWLTSLDGAADPISTIQTSFTRYIQEDIDSGFWVQGCPLNNLAQEMSPLDEGFQQRIHAQYTHWRGAFARALEGALRPGVSPHTTAVLLVAAQMGIWGTAKGSRDATLMTTAGDAIVNYLDSLRQ